MNRKKPTDKPDALLQRALQAQQAGNAKQALAAWKRYFRLVPDNAEALHLAAGLAYGEGQVEQAIQWLRRACELAPDNPDYINDLGGLCLAQRRFEEAVRYYSRALELTPETPQIHYNLAIALHGTGDTVRAVRSLECALRLKPDYAEARFNLGVMYKELGHDQRALECFQQAVKLEPFLARGHQELARAWHGMHWLEKAEQAYRKALSLDREDPATITELASVLHDSGKTEEGLALLREYLQRHPHSVTVHVALGRLLLDAGELEEAETAYRRAMKLKGDSSGPINGLAGVRRFTEADRPLIGEMESLLATMEQESARTSTHFALGKVYNDIGEYDRAFEHYRRANALQRKRFSYDRSAAEELVAAVIETFDEAFFREHEGIGFGGERPLFIVGMPRSGTTLTEQILSSHPEVAPGGELLYFGGLSQVISMELEEPWPRVARKLDPGNSERYWRPYLELLQRHSDSARLVTDKLPGNFMYLGLIRLFFPRAPIIHCRRDPLDVCLSNFFQHFRDGLSYSFDLLDTGHYYLQYRRLMEHWRRVLPGGFLDSDYEALVADPATGSRRLVEYCGLEWSEACLEPHKLERGVKTASNWQVRQPIYRSSARRWKRYEKYLDELKEMLDYRDEG